MVVGTPHVSPPYSFFVFIHKCKLLKVSRIWEEDKGCKKKLKTVHFLNKSDVQHPSVELPHLDIFKNRSHYENSIELEHSKFVQLDQLDPSFHNLCGFSEYGYSSARCWMDYVEFCYFSYHNYHDFTDMILFITIFMMYVPSTRLPCIF